MNRPSRPAEATARQHRRSAEATTRRRSIRFALVATRLGSLLVAASERGLCHVRFGDDAAALEAELREELPFATLRHDPRGLAAWAEALRGAVDLGRPCPPLPLDVRGSRFQRRVWEALRRIPAGRTRSYGELASELGLPGGARAVARACASNPVAVGVPCHRVVPAAGGAGGYRWGEARKRGLLEGEARALEARQDGPAAA